MRYYNSKVHQYLYLSVHTSMTYTVLIGKTYQPQGHMFSTTCFGISHCTHTLNVCKFREQSADHRLYWTGIIVDLRVFCRAFEIDGREVQSRWQNLKVCKYCEIMIIWHLMSVHYFDSVSLLVALTNCLGVLDWHSILGHFWGALQLTLN